MLTNTISKVIYNGNGVATSFPFTFKVWESDQLIVQEVNSNGVATVINANKYTVTLSASGGTVTYLRNGNPLPAGYKLAILRNMPFKQEVDLISGTRFDPQVIETQLDQATAERQQLLEMAKRAIVVPPTSSETQAEFVESIFTARDNAEGFANNAKGFANDAEEALDAIIELSITVTTLNPGASCTASYNSSTGVLSLGIPKGDQGIRGIQGERGFTGETGTVEVATATTLGGIKVGEGLTITRDGVLSLALKPLTPEDIDWDAGVEYLDGTDEVLERGVVRIEILDSFGAVEDDTVEDKLFINPNTTVLLPLTVDAMGEFIAEYGETADFYLNTGGTLSMELFTMFGEASVTYYPPL